MCAHIAEGETKRNKCEELLQMKVASRALPNARTRAEANPRPVYLEEEGMYILCRLYRYGMQADVYKQITKDIGVSKNDVKKNMLESDWLAPCFGLGFSPSAALTSLGTFFISACIHPRILYPINRFVGLDSTISGTSLRRTPK